MNLIYTIAASLTLAICVSPVVQAKGKPILGKTKVEDLRTKTKYGYRLVKGHVRAGNKAQRFELRHGDCGRNKGWSDCDNDRQRIERKEKKKNTFQKLGKTAWYGWSIYLQPNFPDITKSNITLGQMKLKKWRTPVWSIGVHRGYMVVSFADHKNCKIGRLTNWNGRWVDLVIHADYSTKLSVQGAFNIWVNGKKACSRRNPIITREMVNDSARLLGMKYGIYNSYVSRWLSAHAKKMVTAKAFVDKHSKNKPSKSATNRPFDYDWGIKLPTQVVYYDEMRYGTSRGDVDIRLLEQAGVKPLD